MTVDSILVNAKSPQTKFFGLQILDEAVNVSNFDGIQSNIYY